MTTLAKHTDSSFDTELEAVRGKLLEMGGIAEAMIVDSVAALVQRDEALADRVVATDRRLDALQTAVEEMVVVVIARRQPVAVDLRAVVGALRIAGNLERIGDLSKNVARRAAILGQMDTPHSAVLAVKRIADLARMQLTDVLDAYDRGDLNRALDVWRRDADTDGLFGSVFRELLTYMAENPRTISACAHLMFCAKNVERIGDHATNIAETVHYIETGEPIAGERPKIDSATAVS